VEGTGYLSKQMLNYRERTHLLQFNLYRKAVQESGYKFYVLYDKVFLRYILRYAWEKVKESGGSPGVDKVSMASMAEGDAEQYLHGLSEDLRKRTYRPSPVKRVWIAKSNGGKRALGIPTVRDRTVQMACKLITEPIFEADFEDGSCGFRPGRDAQGAIKELRREIKAGLTEVYDADISQYFDTIPHAKLMTVLKQRISDP
jgi:retron-type reverse transcriptase